jgi:hypothetical protein
MMEYTTIIASNFEMCGKLWISVDSHLHCGVTDIEICIMRMKIKLFLNVWLYGLIIVSYGCRNNSGSNIFHFYASQNRMWDLYQ